MRFILCLFQSGISELYGNALPIQRIGDVLVRCSGTVEGEQHLNDPLLFRNDLQCAATDLVSI